MDHGVGRFVGLQHIEVAGEELGRYYESHYRKLAKDRIAHPIDFRSIRFPGIISSDTVPSGGTSDYGPEMIHAAAQGRAYVNIAFGCTGGQHCSVFMAEEIAKALREAGFAPTLLHRNLAARPVDQIEDAQGTPTTR